MDCPYETIKIESPSGFYVEVERYEEHHMGAETVELIPSAELYGVNRFRTTNGSAFYDAATEHVFLYDSCLILEVDPRTLICRHCNRPEGWYISDFSHEGDKFCFRLYDGSGGHDEREIAYDEIPWLEGLSFACAGRFPSAYQ